MPFIPRKDLRGKYINRINQLNNEEILLAACIKNLCQPLSDDSAVNQQYLMIKSAFVNAEVSGALNLKLLQALLLLLFYEYGHGIYPSAFLTLGTCARYLAVLGIDGASSHFEDDDDWKDSETRRRVWWAVYIVERWGKNQL